MNRRELLKGGAALFGLGAVGLAGCASPAAPGAAAAPPRYYDPTRRGPRRTLAVDVCVYGATAGGIMAAIAAARQGRSVALLAFNDHLGGMTTSGLSATDVGDRRTITGLAGEFYRNVGAVYGDRGPAYQFEAKVAARVIRAMLGGSGATVLTRQPLADVAVRDGRITSIRTEAGSVVTASTYVDASYEGDLMARAGVAYRVGREANAEYGETLNGIRPAPPGNGFRVKVPAAAHQSSTLVSTVSPAAGRPGDADGAVMAYGFRPTITTAPASLPYPRPSGYSAGDFSLVAETIGRGEWDILNFRVALPSAKYDLNAEGGVSTDAVGLGAGWAEAGYARRQELFDAHLRYDQGLLWYLANDPHVPATIQSSTRRFGLPSDEFTSTGGWPPELYVREARRMVSPYVTTEAHCVGGAAAGDPIAVASYKIDSHACRRLAVDGVVTDEGVISHGIPRPYGISLRSILPAPDQCTNLAVSSCVASSHVAWSSLRMEPVFMMLGHAAGLVAAEGARQRADLADLPYQQLRDRLVSSGLAVDPPPAPSTPAPARSSRT